MNPLSALGAKLHAATDPNSTEKIKTEKIKGAAQQFESLMLTELLKTARSEKGWMGTGEEDEAGQNALDMAEQQFANVMSKAGGLGMQNFIVQNLLPKK